MFFNVFKIFTKCYGLFSPKYVNGSSHHLASVTTENALPSFITVKNRTMTGFSVQQSYQVIHQT